MPPTQVELDYGYETLDGVIYVGNREQHFWVAHEAVTKMLTSKRT